MLPMRQKKKKCFFYDIFTRFIQMYLSSKVREAVLCVCCLDSFFQSISLSLYFTSLVHIFLSYQLFFPLRPLPFSSSAERQDRSDCGRVICVVYQRLQGHTGARRWNSPPIKIDIAGNEEHLWRIPASSGSSWMGRPFRWRLTFPLL